MSMHDEHSPQGVELTPGFTIQAFRQDPGNGCFAYTAGSGEKECVVDSVLVQPIDQGLGNMLLPHQLFKGFWAPFSRQYLVAHQLSNVCL